MSTHTPGPWRHSKVANRYDDYSIYSQSENCGAGDNLANSVRGKANALLIAAAPEMIAALQEIEEQLFGHPDRDVGNSKVHYAWQKARAAIAEATNP
jgi:hypothetical protein